MNKNRLTKKIVTAGVIGASVLMLAACGEPKEKAGIRAEENPVPGRYYMTSMNTDIASSAKDNSFIPDEIINDREAHEMITIPMEDMELPEGFNEEWLLPNTYNGNLGSNGGIDFDIRKDMVDEIGYSLNTLIIALDQNVTDEQKESLLKEFGAEILYDYDSISAMAIKFPEEKTIEELEQVIEEITAKEFVVSAEKDLIMRMNGFK